MIETWSSYAHVSKHLMAIFGEVMEPLGSALLGVGKYVTSQFHVLDTCFLTSPVIMGSLYKL